MKLNLLIGSAVLLGLTACAPSSAPAPQPAADTPAERADTGDMTRDALRATVITEDIGRFWEAYDRIAETDDPRTQLDLLNQLYIDRGSPGLHAMMRARNYRSGEYLEAINGFPDYWAAIRPQTLMVERYREEIETALREFDAIYDNPRPVPVYFVIGALRAAGTAIDGKLLVGAELAMANDAVPADEFPDYLSHLDAYFARNPIDNIVALNLHEYVHVVQNSLSGDDLLSQALLEGVAEYLSTEGIGRTSAETAILFGIDNREAVLDAFAAEIGNESFEDWIWNSTENQFGVRDLGYYVGYAITQAYLAQAEDRRAAIAHIIEMDYQDRDAVAAVVDASGVFDEPVAVMRARYEAANPPAPVTAE